MQNKRIDIFTQTIKEGGGPMGYVYNMIQGLSKIDNFDFDINFYARTFASKSNQNTVCFYIECFVNKVKTKIRFLKQINILKHSNLCVFQGYQDSNLLLKAKKKNKICIYMPHSPYIYADEIKKLYELEKRNISIEKYNKFYSNEKKLISNADIIVFPTKNAASEYYKNWDNLINSKKIYFIESGVVVRKLDRKSEVLNNFIDKKKICFIGRYVEHKGFDLFCKCAKRMQKKNDIVFISAGSGPLKGQALVNNVIDLGFIKDIGSVISNIDLVVIANTVAYYDLLPLECASYGKPLLMSYVGGNIDQLNDLPDTLSFEANNIEQLEEKIKAGIQIIEKNPNWGVKNKDKYEEKFTDLAMMNRWLAMFEEILN